MIDKANPLKVLFVCHFNMMRSATAEEIFKDDPLLEVKSAGISPEALVVIDRHLVDWADIIFVMEEKQKHHIEKNFRKHLSDTNIICLSIDDRYDFMDERLIEKLKSTVAPHLKKIFSSARTNSANSRDQ